MDEHCNRKHNARGKKKWQDYRGFHRINFNDNFDIYLIG